MQENLHPNRADVAAEPEKADQEMAVTENLQSPDELPAIRADILELIEDLDVRETAEMIQLRQAIERQAEAGALDEHTAKPLFDQYLGKLIPIADIESTTQEELEARLAFTLLTALLYCEAKMHAQYRTAITDAALQAASMQQLPEYVRDLVNYLYYSAEDTYTDDN